MHHGKVHEEGRPKNLFTSPNTPELAQFIGSIG
jgi:polar amino acid transport system ATP-binding protein